LMNRVQNIVARCQIFVQQVAWVVLAGYIWLEASPLAFAKKQKVEEVAAPTKSYVMPYMIVLMLIGLGLMTILRPASRLDKPDEKKKDSGE